MAMTNWTRRAGLVAVLALGAAGCNDRKEHDSRETGRQVGRELRQAGQEASEAAKKAGHEVREGVEGLREGLGRSGASDAVDADGGHPATREPVPQR